MYVMAFALSCPKTVQLLDMVTHQAVQTDWPTLPDNVSCLLRGDIS